MLDLVLVGAAVFGHLGQAVDEGAQQLLHLLKQAHQLLPHLAGPLSLVRQGDAQQLLVQLERSLS